ncbi:PREDICTED: isoleucine--tRNA ligase, mitochondrial [Wasmannia auropunctata]|uniref:isoleucine--tRNA ligase, mitochondrial n=1 Tax=Wasmannia auropunctata TaxID=64793 RepID=UPI0005EECCBE|nr:PREDICTED: isoleucine--tRNA ligase, mitochondrial [Wasmannia auropunctata]
MSVLTARMRRLFKTTGFMLRTYAEFCRAMCLRGMKSAAKQSYTKTVLLPQTNFPARIGGRKRVEMDSYLIEKCGFLELYNWQRQNLKGPDFILHDGPPYANGELHMGHAINKVLKDITLRSKIITGRRVHYVPGWDCHGLPIEQKVLSDIKDVKDSPLEIRRKAGRYASDAIAKQRQVFTSWGITADWSESGCYFTNHVSYVKNQMQQFVNLYDKGLVFRAFKPVHWSPSSRTALAESELEYNESHESKSVIVRMRLDTHTLTSRLKNLENRPLYALIWTTTPWSLIANQAIAFASNIAYCIVEDNSKTLYILAQERLADIEQKLGPLKLITTIMGRELSEAKYLHPITKRHLPFLSGHHVTTNVGTGLVHTAPAHGNEDFLVAVENNIPVLSLIDDDGCFTKEAGDEFSGLNVLTNDCANKILQRIGEDVLHAGTITHSYPYDWRTKKPVIIRASHQWFIDIMSIKERAIDSIANIRIYPEQNRTSYLNALIAQVKQRPYWCISRQRAWGTPIPVLHNKRTGDTYTSRKWVERLCKLMERHGTDYWWELSTEKLIGRELRQELNDNIDDLERGTDIMDIWLDSGLSWSAVLPEHKADLYLEGMDQFRGWFQSSLLTSIALQERPPYSALFVHGFAVDDKASKMSKSIGNVLNPEIITKGGENLSKNPAYGVDTLRWWVASHGCQHSQVPVTTALLSESHETVQKLRLVLRFLLGVLHSYSEGNIVEPEYLYLDKYMLHALHQYNKEIQGLYDNYLYHHACKLITNFLTNTVSPVYCHLIKDRLYCDEAASPTRLAAVEVTRGTLTVLARSIAPIVPHLAEEVWLYHPENLASVPLYHSEYKVSETWHQPEIARHVQTALNLRSKVNTLSDRYTWELSGILKASKDDYESLSMLQKDRESSTSELCDILQLSSIILIESPTVTETQVELRNIEKMICQRCRRHPELDKNGLCGRCAKVLDVANVSSISV